MTGLVAQVILVSILGFLAMLASAFFAVTSYRAVTTANQLGVVDGTGVRKPRTTTRRSRGAAASSGGFMQRMEDRWNRRRDDGR